jgi:hypothetical protein
MISFKASKTEYRLLARIAARAVELAKSMGWHNTDFVEIEMDLTACHCNGCPLDLEKLLSASDGDFGHDLFGIRQHIDRKTGELRDCFLPRCSEPEVSHA